MILTRIAEFKPNTAARSAAETLAGLKAVGAVVEWYFDDDSFHIRLYGGEAKVATASTVMDMGLGVRALMAHQLDKLGMRGE